MNPGSIAPMPFNSDVLSLLSSADFVSLGTRVPQSEYSPSLLKTISYCIPWDIY